MTKVVVLGHGGYGSAIQRNLKMLIGDLEDYYYIDFNEQDDLDILKQKIGETLAQIGENDVLFCCDLAGGSPFREAAMICAEKSNFCCVAGLNTSAYTEMSFNLEMSPFELADLAVEVAKESILRFPPAEE